MSLMRVLVKASGRSATTRIGRSTARPKRSVASTRPSIARIAKRKKLF